MASMIQTNCPLSLPNIDSTIFCQAYRRNLRPRVANTVISITIAIMTHVAIKVSILNVSPNHLHDLLDLSRM